MEHQIKTNMGRTSTWQRGFFILLFALFYSVAELVMTAVVVVQFGFLLLTGETNPRLLSFGAALSRYIYEVYLFLSFNRDDKPFPFGEWPDGESPTAVRTATEQAEPASAPAEPAEKTTTVKRTRSRAKKTE